MALIYMKNPFGRHRLTWTLFGVLCLWLTIYSWNYFEAGSLYLTPSSPRSGSNTTNYSGNQERFFVRTLSNVEDLSSSRDERLVKIMTWNLQGLLKDKLTERTVAVVSVIRNEVPDAIFFQELIPSSYEQISQSLEDTYSYVSGAKNAYSSHFVGIFFKKLRFKIISYEIRSFSNSAGGRTLLIVKLARVHRPELKLALMATHLKAHPDSKKPRLEQLNECFSLSTSLDGKYNVVFGGDLNLEAGEEEGLVPEGVKDSWTECGSSEALKYTWDMRKNTNDRVPGVSIEEQPRARYDRLYFRSATEESLIIKSLQLFGQKEVEGTLFFPSDHYALMSTFELTEVAGGNRSVCTSIG